MISVRTACRATAVLGALAVALGATGAHGAVHDRLVAAGMLAIWEKAVFYQGLHVAVMLALSLVRPETFRQGPWLFFLAGILLFSGSLYCLALTEIRGLGAITPFGGLSFIIGWLWLALCPPRDRSKTADNNTP